MSNFFDIDYDGRLRKNDHRTNTIADSTNGLRTARGWEQHDTGYVKDGHVYSQGGTWLGKVRNDNRPDDRRR